MTDGEPRDDAAAGSGQDAVARDVPLADLAAAVARRRNGADDTTWRKADAEAPGDEFVEAEATTPGDPTDDPVFAAEREAIDTDAGSAVVPKRDYCERCPHFAVPPGASCTNEGTTIEAFEGRGRVRLDSCPIVAERLSGDPTTEG